MLTDNPMRYCGAVPGANVLVCPIARCSIRQDFVSDSVQDTELGLGLPAVGR